MSKLKSLVINLIGFNNYRKIIVFIFRMTNNFHIKNHYAVDVDKVLKLSQNKRNVFFGYYDNSSYNDNKILYLSTSYNQREKAQIFYFDVEKKQDKFIGETRSWNTQMGSRLRWLSKEKIIYNDYDDKYGYISKVLDINTKKTEKFNFPIYDLSHDKKYSFFLNFSLLNKYRPGYGYCNLDNNYIHDNGIYKGNLENNTYETILSINDIIRYKNNSNIINSNVNYINHICTSPYKDNLMFFHLWKENENLRGRVFIIDYNGNIINVIDDFERASHYTFKNEEELLLTVVINGENQYRLYNINNGKYKLLDFLSVDGHPSYIDKDRFITDTYPDHNGMQHIYLCDEKNILLEIAQIYHNPGKNEELRCDLHPRYHNGFLTFDSLNRKYREQQILKINLNDIENLKHKQIKEPYTQKIYKHLYNKIDTNVLKLLYSQMFNFSYRAHILLYKMLHTKNKFLTEIYFNKLQKEFSIWISPKCKIGEDFRMMHFDGITIGSGVVIGDNCTIYHQVTIGKEKEKFPIIGDNVTIYAGAKVIGGIKIGNNVTIGANAVVTKDVPDNCVVAGIPAKIIKRI